MIRSRIVAAGVRLGVQAPWVASAQDPPAPTVRSIVITGAKEIAEPTIRAELHVRAGEPLATTPDEISRVVETLYRREDFTFARVTTTFDEADGALSVAIDEGKIDGVEFEGVDEHLARSFADDFALRAGDIFNRKRARQALDVLLQQTRGAVTPGRLSSHSITSSEDLSRRHGTFDLVDRDGRRMLIVGLREPLGRFHVAAFGEREDWFTPVDGFVPSLD